MDVVEVATALGPELSAALQRKGYTQLTPVQQAVLDPALAGRDLRITSQTGSGKTVALGIALRALALEPDAEPTGKAAQPRALVVAPTRELARQTQDELHWLYADCGVRVVALTGGASYRDEMRGLAQRPRVVVGTPGRLLDHLDRHSLDPSQVAAVVLDEADRLLDMGFREDLERILKVVPEGRRTHLVSATFPRVVSRLADSVQGNPAHVAGTRLGAANEDIEHVIHVVDSRQRVDAIVNLLLASAEPTLVFARTRADVGMLCDELVRAGFAAAALSGELDQAARTRALSAFKQGERSCLVATDVAARGIDVQDVTRVIHAEPPTSAVAYTHRAGRTGRAGRKGTSCLLITPRDLNSATRLLRTANIPFRVEPPPSAASIRRAADERIFESLTQPAGDGPAEDEGRVRALAQRLLATGQSEEIVARLLRVYYSAKAEPRELKQFAAPSHAGPRHATSPGPAHKQGRAGRRFENGAGEYEPSARPARGRPPVRTHRMHGDAPVHPAAHPAEGAAREPRASADRAVPAGRRDRRKDGADPVARSARIEAAYVARDESVAAGDAPPARKGAERRGRQQQEMGGEQSGGAVRFHVSWGTQDGADARKLLALLCRRGQIRGKDVGAIRIEADHSVVEVASEVASNFEAQAGRPDKRDRGVHIRPLSRDGRSAPGRR